MISTLAAAVTGRREPLDRHIDRVDQVAAIAQPPPQWTALRDRWDSMVDFGDTTLLQRLITAIIDGTNEDVATLKALAAVEAGASGQRADVIIAVRAEVHPRLVQLYSDVAAANYHAVAKQSDSAAADFNTSAGQCGEVGPEADTDAVVRQRDPVRTAWLDCAKHAAGLDRLVPVLCAAAELNGVATGDEILLLPLVCDPRGCHRRRVWEAWRADGRCSKWSAPTAFGCAAPGRQPRHR